MAQAIQFDAAKLPSNKFDGERDWRFPKNRIRTERLTNIPDNKIHPMKHIKDISKFRLKIGLNIRVMFEDLLHCFFIIVLITNMFADI